MLFNSIAYCLTLLYHVVLFCIVVYCIVLYCFSLFCTNTSNHFCCCASVVDDRAGRWRAYMERQDAWSKGGDVLKT